MEDSRKEHARRGQRNLTLQSYPNNPLAKREATRSKRGKGIGSRVTALVDFSRAATLTQASASRGQTNRRYQALGRYAVSKTNGEVKGEKGLDENPNQAQGGQRLNMTPRIAIRLNFFGLPFSLQTDRPGSTPYYLDEQ